MNIAIRTTLAAVAAAVLAALPGTAGAQLRPPPPMAYQNEILQMFTDQHYRLVPYRRGYWYPEQPNTGFGTDKVRNKHNITDSRILVNVIRQPGSARHQDADRWQLRGYWQHRKCDARHNCSQVEGVTVLVIVDYDPPEGSGEAQPVGVVTAYCEGMIRCPDWLNNLMQG